MRPLGYPTMLCDSLSRRAKRSHGTESCRSVGHLPPVGARSAHGGLDRGVRGGRLHCLFLGDNGRGCQQMYHKKITKRG
ncbi:hypothetical protein AAFF_G00186760 [Aldrovandia affinis]|uniref:Uncharacterized protein n=1 Tax=Aldrovandia affinis TaxID=143900 RepID=A0AAD7SXQ3_9TELE|nr:hypothetical protein AAFF_G00186760 [Aldrovandia affinis]